MSYRLPTFNVTIAGFHIGNSTGVPDYTTSANVCLGRRVYPVPGFTYQQPEPLTVSQIVLVPTGTPIVPMELSLTVQRGDLVVLDPTRTFSTVHVVMSVSYVGFGFPNEHLSVMCLPLTGYACAQLDKTGGGFPWPFWASRPIVYPLPGPPH